jgi:hypothetical protein
MLLKEENLRILSVTLAAVILGVVGTFYIKERIFQDAPAAGDAPPTITFTWTPLGRVFLEDVRGKLHMTDDHGLDFTTYSMHIVEIDKTLDLPIPGLSGKDYEQDISFLQFATNVELLKRGQMTLEFRIKDDAGQETLLTKVIKVRNDFAMPSFEIGPPKK